jgi:hypothetical protein
VGIRWHEVPVLNFLDLLAIGAYFLILLVIGLRVMRSTGGDVRPHADAGSR